MSKRKSNIILSTYWLKRIIRLLAIWEAINCTRNRIYSLKVFQFLLYWRSSILQDIHFLDRIRRFLTELINKRKSRKRDISIIAKDKPYVHHKTHLRTMKVYNTRPVILTIEVVLIKIAVFFVSTTEVITCSNAFKQWNSWPDPFRKSSTWNFYCMDMKCCK